MGCQFDAPYSNCIEPLTKRKRNYVMPPPKKAAM